MLLSNFSHHPLFPAINHQPLTTNPDTSLTAAIALMAESGNNGREINSSCLLVMQDQQPVGILTERDIVRLTAAEVTIEGLTVAQVMTRNLITGTISELQDIFAVLKQLKKNQIRHLPILNPEGELVGIVTPTSIRRTLKPADLLKLRRVSEVYTAEVIQGKVNSCTLDLARLMTRYKVSCIVIVDKEQPVGMVTEKDIVQWRAQGLNLTILTAQEVMSNPVLTIASNCSLWEAHQTMQAARIRRLVVTSAEGTLQGIITQSSILQPLDPVEMYSIIQLLQEQISNLQVETEANLKIIFEQAVIPMVIINQIGQLLQCNPYFSQLINREPNQLIGQIFTNLIYPEDRGIYLAKTQKLLTGNFQDISLEIRLQKKQGSGHWVKLGISPLNRPNQDLAFLIIVEDQQELKEKENRWQTVLESAPLGTWEWNIIEDQITWSNNLERLFGFNPGQFDGKYETFLNCLHPEDRFRVQEAINRTLKEHQEYHLEFRVVLPNGQIRWALSQGQVFYDPLTGEPVYMTGVDLDITDRKKNEQALQEANHNLLTKIRELEERNREIGILNDLNDFLQTCQTAEEAYLILGELLPPLFPESSGNLFRNNTFNNQLETVTAWGDNLDTKLNFFWQECWGLRRGHFYHSSKQKPGLLCSHIQPTTDKGDSLCLPLIAQGETLGLLYISTEIEQFTAPKRQLAYTVSEQIALALSNLDLRHKLQEQTSRDPLTNLFNRRYLEESLNREIQRAKRSQKSIGIVMIDVDHFKTINDRFGHERGDVVLQELAKFLESHVRASDLVCRYGGEELLLVLPESSLEDTYQRSEMIRENVKNLTLVDGEDLNMTISLGIAAFPNHGNTMQSLLREADRALYQAKERGRDCVVIAEV